MSACQTTRKPHDSDVGFPKRITRWICTTGLGGCERAASDVDHYRSPQAPKTITAAQCPSVLAPPPSASFAGTILRNERKPQCTRIPERHPLCWSTCHCPTKTCAVGAALQYCWSLHCNVGIDERWRRPVPRGQACIATESTECFTAQCQRHAENRVGMDWSTG